jgi:hypothetical protein
MSIVIRLENRFVSYERVELQHTAVSENTFLQIRSLFTRNAESEFMINYTNRNEISVREK